MAMGAEDPVSVANGRLGERLDSIREPNPELADLRVDCIVAAGLSALTSARL
jgi:hypothetical protein